MRYARIHRISRIALGIVLQRYLWNGMRWMKYRWSARRVTQFGWRATLLWKRAFRFGQLSEECSVILRLVRREGSVVLQREGLIRVESVPDFIRVALPNPLSWSMGICLREVFTRRYERFLMEWGVLGACGDSCLFQCNERVFEETQKQSLHLT